MTRRLVLGAVAGLTSFVLISTVLTSAGVGAAPASAADVAEVATVTLSANRSTFLAGQSVRLTARADVDVAESGQAIRIIEQASGMTVGECTSGKVCRADVKFFTGGERNYLASVGEIESEPLVVTRAPWAIELAADRESVKAGQTTRLLATTNQNVGRTGGAYKIYIFDMTSASLLGWCENGRSCPVRTEPFYADDDELKNFVAVVAATGAPATLGDVEDVQATSSPASVARAAWEIGVTTNLEETDELSVGDTVRITATTNQNVTHTNSKYAVHLFEMSSGEHLKSCDSGTRCRVNYTWRGGHDTNSLVFQAFIAPPSVSDVEALTGVLAADGIVVGANPWELDFAGDESTLSAGEVVTLTATTDQNVGRSDSNLATYIIEWVDGRILKTCTSGTQCVVNDSFYRAGQQFYAHHAYAAIVAEYAPGLTSPDQITGYRSIEQFRVDRVSWDLGMHLTGTPGQRNQFTVESNQDLGKTKRQLALYLFNGETDRFEAACYTGSRCLLSAKVNSSTGFFALVAERSDNPPETSHDLTNVHASASVVWSPPSDSAVSSKPILGPNLPKEGIAGCNPAETPAQCSRADPVNTASGEYYENDTDLSIAGVGPALRVSRSYSTGNLDEQGAFGFGWSSNLDSRLDFVMPGSAANPNPRQVEVVQETGATVLFTRRGTSDYAAMDRLRATLTFDTDASAWRFVRNQREVMTFDSSGMLTSFVDLQGNAVHVSRDSDRRVSGLTASGGRSISVTWSGDRVQAVSDSSGRAVLYTYDDGAELVSVVAPDGGVASYSYDDKHRIVSVTTPGGGVTSNTYDVQGRVVSQVDPIGRLTTFAYETTWSSGATFESTTVTSPDGVETVDRYLHGALVSQTRAAGTELEATMTYEYDHSLNMVARTDPAGFVTRATFGDDGLKLTETDPLDRVTSWTYTTLGDVASITDALGRVTQYEYDESGNLVTARLPGERVEMWTYNPDGTAATYQDAAGSITHYEYAASGLPTAVIDPTGRTTQTGYNAAGFATSVTDAGGNAITLTVDALGRIVASSDALGRQSTFGFDAAGNLVSRTDPTGATIAASYNAAGERTSVTDAAGAATQFRYSASGLLTETEAPEGVIYRNTYDALAHRTSAVDALDRVTQFSYDAIGRLTAATTPSGATSESVYDAAGQLIETIDPNGESTSFAYDAAGRQISVTDPLGRVTSTSYTANDQVLAVTLPDGSVVSYSYDLAGNQIGHTNADGQSSVYQYDAAGRRLSQQRPGGALTSYEYDGAGRLVLTTFPDLTTATSSYDPAGQLAAIDYSVGDDSDATFEYDLAGRRVTMSDATGVSGFVYDAAGRLVAQTDGTGATLGYEYDSLGRTTSLAYPNGDTVAYGYDAASQLVQLTDWNGASTQFTWNADGRLVSRTDPNGISYEVGYDAAGRVSDLAAHGSAENLLHVAYTYDSAGQLASRAVDGSAVSASNASYTYDQLGQLASADPGGAYVSTPAGQLVTTADGAVLSYDPAQQLQSRAPPSAPATTYSYDVNGARITATTDSAITQYGYEAAGRLASFTNGESTVAYTSNADGLRQSRSASDESKHFIWSQVRGLPLLLDDGEYRYLYGPGAVPIAQYGADGAAEYLYGDVVGSTLLIADAAATEFSSLSYSEYGSVIGRTGDLATRFGFTGNWTDPISGLVHLRARDFDPVTGQFLRVDPAVMSTQQAYTYAGNNPMQFTDFTGLDWLSDSLEGVLAFGAGVASGLTIGLSDVLFSATVPGYDCFVEKNSASYTAGEVTVLVAQVAVAVVAAIPTGGASLAVAGLMIGAKLGVKAAIKTTVNVLKKVPAATARAKPVAASAQGPISSVTANASAEAFHYTSSTAARSIMADGMRAGSFATPKGGMSPLQASIELALPPNRPLPDALIRIDLAGLRMDGRAIPNVSPVSNVVVVGGRVYTRPAGGLEMQFRDDIPASFLSRLY